MRYLKITAIWITICSGAICQAAELPEDAKRELEALQRYEKEQTRETSKRIINRKEQAVKKLEKIEKSLDAEGMGWAKKLILEQLIAFRNEIDAAKGNNEENGKADKKGDNDQNDNDDDNWDDSNREALKILNFNKSYFYKHPSQDFQNEVGELIFYGNGKVNCYHRLGKQIRMFKKWRWKMKGDKIEIIADKTHGPIFVTKRSPREINLDWKGLINKKNVAKQK